MSHGTVYRLHPSGLGQPTYFKTVAGAKASADQLLQSFLDLSARRAADPDEEEDVIPLATGLVWEDLTDGFGAEVMQATYCKDWWGKPSGLAGRSLDNRHDRFVITPVELGP